MHTLKNYTGNKGMPGLWQFIVNRIPPHDLYYEMFAGSGTIARILPGSQKILVDLNTETICALRKDLPAAQCVHADAIRILQSFSTVAPGTRSFRKLQSKRTVGTSELLQLQLKATVQARGNVPWPLQSEITVPDGKVMIYADPPYMISSLLSGKKLYKHILTDLQHKQFVIACSKLKVNCMISHPENDMYDTYLQGWTKEKFKVSYHGKIAEECIYYNYPRPEQLQTYNYVGEDCWDRQGVKRKIERLARKLAALPALERNAVIARTLKSIPHSAE